MSVRKTTVLCCVCLLLAVGAVAVLFPFGVFSPPPSYDYREEQFTGSQDWQAYLQLEGVDPDNPPAFPVHHYDQAVKLVTVEPGAFYRAVREGTLRNLLQDSDRYEWIIPRSYHGTEKDFYRFRYYDGAYSVPNVPHSPEPEDGYAFALPDVVEQTLQQAGLCHPDFIAPCSYINSSAESYLYIEQDGKPYVLVFTSAPQFYEGLEGSGHLYPYSEFQKVMEQKCQEYINAVYYEPLAYGVLPLEDWYYNYFNGFYQKQQITQWLYPAS